MSFSSIYISPQEFSKHVQDFAEKIGTAAVELELLQTNLFPNYNRAYDVCVTFCLPYVTNILANAGILHGQAGLLECFEAFHKYYSNITAYESAVSTDTRESRNQYKFTTIWLVFASLPLQEYSVMVKPRKKKAVRPSDIIPNDSNYGSSESCYCGASKNVTNCSFCNAGGNKCTVKDVYDLINKTKKFYRPDEYLTSLEKNNIMYTRADQIKRNKKLIFVNWQDKRRYQPLTGLRCKPIS